MKFDTKRKLLRWLETTNILWLFTVPLIMGALILSLSTVFDNPSMKIDDLIWHGIAWGVFGISWLTVILRKEWPLRIFFDIVSIKGDSGVIVGWIGLLLCWLTSIGSFVRIIFGD